MPAQQLVHFEKKQKLNMPYLLITLTPEGKAYLEEQVEEHGKTILCPDALMWEVFEHPLCNGWERVDPSDIGALTSAPIVSDEVQRDEDGKIIACDNVYAFMQYEASSVCELLLKNDEVIFTHAGIK